MAPRTHFDSILCATTRAILDRWYHLLFPGDVQRIKASLPKWRAAINRALDIEEESEYLNIFGFIDGTARRICRPSGASVRQQSVYDGHHHYHGFDYEAVTTPDGLIVRLFGPVAARHNDMWMVAHSKIQEMISDQFVDDETAMPYFVYGDQGYTPSPFLMAGLRVPNKKQRHVNFAWSKQRVAVEWSFGEIVGLWQTLDCFAMQRPQQRMVAAWYLVSALLTNCFTCMYRTSEAAIHFDVAPPTIEQYLRRKDDEFETWVRLYRSTDPEVVLYSDIKTKEDWKKWAADHPRARVQDENESNP